MKQQSNQNTKNVGITESKPLCQNESHGGHWYGLNMNISGLS
jgi:hypothetical protein